MGYKLEFETRTAIPTLQNSFETRINLEMGGGWGWGGEPIKAGRTRLYLKASAEDNWKYVNPRKQLLRSNQRNKN